MCIRDRVGAGRRQGLRPGTRARRRAARRAPRGDLGAPQGGRGRGQAHARGRAGVAARRRARPGPPGGTGQHRAAVVRGRAHLPRRPRRRRRTVVPRHPRRHPALGLHPCRAHRRRAGRADRAPHDRARSRDGEVPGRPAAGARETPGADRQLRRDDGRAAAVRTGAAPGVRRAPGGAQGSPGPVDGVGHAGGDARRRAAVRDR